VGLASLAVVSCDVRGPWVCGACFFAVSIGAGRIRFEQGDWVDRDDRLGSAVQIRPGDLCRIDRQYFRFLGKQVFDDKIAKPPTNSCVYTYVCGLKFIELG
jgi:hypothetical protein